MWGIIVSQNFLNIDVTLQAKTYSQFHPPLCENNATALKSVRYSEPHYIELTQTAQISKKQYIAIYAIMTTMHPPGYHHNSFVATHGIVHII